jgi:hypothetical protein
VYEVEHLNAQTHLSVTRSARGRVELVVSERKTADGSTIHALASTSHTMVLEACSCIKYFDPWEDNARIMASCVARLSFRDWRSAQQGAQWGTHLQQPDCPATRLRSGLSLPIYAALVCANSSRAGGSPEQAALPGGEDLHGEASRIEMAETKSVICAAACRQSRVCYHLDGSTAFARRHGFRCSRPV